MMKRQTVLTAIFSILGGIVLATGCQTGKTASTGGGVGNAPDCIQGCIAGCKDDCAACCQEACSDCTVNEHAYNCTSIDGCLSFCFECNCMMCTECFDQTFDGVGSGDFNCMTSPSTDSESDSTSEYDGSRMLEEGIDYTVEFEGSKITFTFLKDFNSFKIDYATHKKDNPGLLIKSYSVQGACEANGIIIEDCQKGENSTTHDVWVVNAYGIDG